MKSLLLRTFFVLSIFTIGGVVGGDAQNHAPNPYTTNPLWGELPEGREWGSTSAIYPGPDGTIWVGERCGQNTCVDRTNVDPILQFDRDGKLIQSFGAGMIVWPHGMYVDDEHNVWIADARGDGTRGHQVHKFSSE